jgi:hypothetical protein
MLMSPLFDLLSMFTQFPPEGSWHYDGQECERRRPRRHRRRSALANGIPLPQLSAEQYAVILDQALVKLSLDVTRRGHHEHCKIQSVITPLR